MTLTELCNELSNVTLGESTDELRELEPIVNLSLSRLFADLRPVSVYTLYQREIRPMASPLSFHRIGGVDVTLPLAGRAYGMHLAGRGEYIITVGEETQRHEFDTAGEFFSGLIEGDGTITFTGMLSYDVYSLSFYDEITSENLSDLPTGMPRRYSLSDIIPRFAYPLSMPRGEGGEEIDGAEYIGRELFIPPDYEGVINICFVKAPKRVSHLTPDEEIDVEPWQVGALIHLCAYFSLLESEGALAEKHLDAYLQIIEIPSPESAHRAYGKYIIEDGWA